MDLGGKGFEGVDLIQLVRDVDERREFVNTVRYLRLCKSRTLAVGFEVLAAM
jgi:hypothetical protein